MQKYTLATTEEDLQLGRITVEENFLFSKYIKLRDEMDKFYIELYDYLDNHKIGDMRFIYIINYQVQGDDAQVVANIKALGEWFNFFRNSFVVVSTYKIEDAYNFIATNKATDWFLILEIKINGFWGVLPPEAWEWLQKKMDESKWKR